MGSWRYIKIYRDLRARSVKQNVKPFLAFPFYLLLLGLATNAQVIEPIRPNVVIINVDDLGWKDVGFMGSRFYQTPQIDALAAKGRIYTNAYAAAANCAPSRASLMTRKYTPRHHIYTVDNSDRGASKARKLIPVPNTVTLNDSFAILPEILKQNGYTTCLAGKWHLTIDPTKRGFDVNIGGSRTGNPGSYYFPYKNVPSLSPSSPQVNLTELIMNKTLDFIDSISGKPFFLYYAPYAVHTPIQAVNSLVEKYRDKPGKNGQNNAAYASMIENVDIQVGKLVQRLTEKGLIDNTLIIFTSNLAK